MPYANGEAKSSGHKHGACRLLCSRAHSIVPLDFTYKIRVQRYNCSECQNDDSRALNKAWGSPERRYECSPVCPGHVPGPQNSLSSQLPLPRVLPLRKTVAHAELPPLPSASPTLSQSSALCQKSLGAWKPILSADVISGCWDYMDMFFTCFEGS